MTPREWANEKRAAMLRAEEDRERDMELAYTAVVFYSKAAAGKLPPLKTILAQAKMATLKAEAHSMQLAYLSEHIGVPFRPISPEAKAALERLKARGK